ncbi:MAG: phage integrase SAM-like domain-containing protein [Planctomycetaceae bacterium]|jgi:integrase|nr:phage integrase SAM-like domain-containing protein [Planctomycetaceae bacterium]
MASLTIDNSHKTPGYNIQWLENGHRKTIYIGGKHFDRRTAERLKEVIETLIRYRENGILIPDKNTQVWLETANPAIHEKLAKAGLIKLPEKHTCGELWTEFLKSKTDVKDSTIRIYEATKAKFFEFFSESDKLGSLNLDKFRQWTEYLKENNNAKTSITLYTRQMKTVFNWCRDEKKWVSDNPLAGIGSGTYENHDKDRIITLPEYKAMLKVCPTQEWRVILVLARIGGLRCPSELVPLRWIDFDWERKFFVVRSPKTERYPTGKNRHVPIFPEMVSEIKKLETECNKSSEFVINGFRTPTGERHEKPALTYQFDQISIGAGLGEIERPFDNMRMSRSNELRRNPNIGTKLESMWLGHSQKVADEHYFYLNRADFKRAAEWETEEWLLT